MSIGKSKNKTSQQQSVRQSLSPWSQQGFENDSAGIMGTVNNYTSRPFQAYTGNMVAGLGQGEQAARNIAAANVGQQNGLLDSAVSGVNNAMAYNGTDVSPWYNKYEQDVVNATGAYMDQNLEQALAQNAARATQSGAFGGSRHGVIDRTLTRDAMMDKARTVADLKYRGYDAARAAGFQNQQAQYQGAGILAGLAGEKQASWQRDADYLNKMGATDREIEQMRLDKARGEFDREAKDRYDKMMLELQARQGLLAARPMLTNVDQTMKGTTKGSSFGLKFGFGPDGFSIGG